MMIDRVVIPEWLDSLPHDDPAARRSRRDLRLINVLMGNERWIARSVATFPEAADRGVVELGAGEGRLLARLARSFPRAEMAGYDLAPRPAMLDPRVAWHRGNLLETGAERTGGVLVTNLFLHHFQGANLGRLGEICRAFDVLVISEPNRGRLAMVTSHSLRPFVNHVTRHDMTASIRAGFAAGEIGAALGLGAGWRMRESSTWRGSRRVLVWRT